MAIHFPKAAMRTLVIASAIGIPALGALAWPSPAHADFTVCNKTSGPVRVAVAYVTADGTDYVQRGFWSLRGGGECKLVVASSETADLTTYFYYAKADDGGVWQGDYPFCTASNRPFTIVGDRSCADRGYNVRYFKRVDSTTRNYKVSLTDGSTILDEG